MSMRPSMCSVGWRRIMSCSYSTGITASSSGSPSKNSDAPDMTTPALIRPTFVFFTVLADFPPIPLLEFIIVACSMIMSTINPPAVYHHFLAYFYLIYCASQHPHSLASFRSPFNLLTLSLTQTCIFLSGVSIFLHVSCSFSIEKLLAI